MAKTINNIFSCHISNVESGEKLKNSDVGYEAVWRWINKIVKTLIFALYNVFNLYTCNVRGIE